MPVAAAILLSFWGTSCGWGEAVPGGSRRLGPRRNGTMVLRPGGDAVVPRPERRLHAVGHADLPVDARQVRLDRLLADAEAPRDDLVGVSRRDEGEDLPFAAPQRLLLLLDVSLQEGPRGLGRER